MRTPVVPPEPLALLFSTAAVLLAARLLVRRRYTILLGIGIGAALGALASFSANTYIAGQLFGVTPRDPAAIVVALSVLAIAATVIATPPNRARTMRRMNVRRRDM